MDFNKSISHAMARCWNTCRKMSISTANLIFTRRDSFLALVRSGIKPDTLATLRTAPLHMAMLFPDNVLQKEEDDIASFKGKGSSHHKKGCYHPYERHEKYQKSRKSDKTAWKNMGSRDQKRKHKGNSSRPARGQLYKRQ